MITRCLWGTGLIPQVGEIRDAHITLVENILESNLLKK
jgi:hypothetical protein